MGGLSNQKRSEGITPASSATAARQPDIRVNLGSSPCLAQPRRDGFQRGLTRGLVPDDPPLADSVPAGLELGFDQGDQVRAGPG